MATGLQALGKKLAELAQGPCPWPQKPPSTFQRLAEKKDAAVGGRGGWRTVYLGKSGRARPVIDQAKSRLSFSRNKQQTSQPDVVASSGVAPSDPPLISQQPTVPPMSPDGPTS